MIERMFELGGSGESSLGAAQISALTERLAKLGTGTTDSERIDRIRALEELKAAVSAAQAREVAAFAVSQEADQRARGARADEVGRGIALQVGLAMRASHQASRRFTGFARVLVAEMPHTLAALARGKTTERRAFLVAQHTILLPAHHRALIDASIGPRLESLGDRQVEAEVNKLAYELDKAGYVKRQSRAEGDRRVTVRPAPDTMAYLTALLPVAPAVACQARLTAAAAALKAAGDPRSYGQLMADLLVDAITGRNPILGSPSVDAPDERAGDSDSRFVGLPAGSGVEIKLVMSDAALLGGSDEAAHLQGFGPVPAVWVRDLLRQRDDSTRVWLRRLFTEPETGALAAIETHRREFTGALRELIIARDQFCRHPWCGAPIRHIDHIKAHAEGGATSLTNGQGLCEACNYAKQAPGWQARPGPDPESPGESNAAHIITPTGHCYTSRPPRPPGRAPALARAG
jgi:5-methylcytosine-specific restriction endonuclease McrA